MTAQDFLHKRILVTIKKRMNYSEVQTVEEIKILEVSPSGNWIKTQDMDGRKYWKHYADLVIVEVLQTLEKNPGK
jgi:hypothetical protein